MPRLGIAKDFLANYAKLQKTVQKSVDAAIERFGQHTHAGIHLEKLANAKDQRIRTIRINQFYRGVVLAPDAGDEFLLIAVLPHNDAITYATSHKFTVNHALGVLEVRNQQGLDSIEPALRQAVHGSPTPLFEMVDDAALVRLGIDREVLPLVRLLVSESHLDALANLLPTIQYDTLAGLAAGMTVEEVWEEISRQVPVNVGAATVDADDIAAAVARTPDRYMLVSGPDELAYILAHPFDTWRIFLHPTQRDFAYRETFAGPAMVTGGAGTGKTVTALHRAVHLAARATDNPRPPVLLTTFTRNLADALASQLGLLTEDASVRDRIEVINIDRLAYRIVTDYQGYQPKLVDQAALRTLWEQEAAATAELSATLLEREWEQVILAQDIRQLDGYLTARRHGRGAPLQAVQRRQVWDAVTHVTETLRRWDQHTHLQLAERAAQILAGRTTQAFQHAIIDEGQDLHPAQWRLLRAAVKPGSNDLFIVSDPHQRIYDNHVSLASIGIGIRGRTHRLTINYRTTQEILGWSVQLLAGITPTGLDDQRDNLVGFRSPVHGRRPAIHASYTRDEEMTQLLSQVNQWLDTGIEPHAIAVAGRSGYIIDAARKVLTAAGIQIAAPTVHRQDAVKVGTMHAMKGLEFQCMAVIGVDAASVPAKGAVTAIEEDPIAHRDDSQRERCLLFVACTRARDALYVSHVGQPSPFIRSATK